MDSDKSVVKAWGRVWGVGLEGVSGERKGTDIILSTRKTEKKISGTGG